MTFEFNTIQLEENPERLKISWPLKRPWLLFGLFSLALVVWLVTLIGMSIYLVRDVIGAGERFTFVFSVMLILWLLVWLWFGRILSNRWQYVAANREILFINPSQLIIRRPVSIFGITDAYDMQHVSRFYVSEKLNCPVFDCGHQHIYFGQSLPQDEAEKLIGMLNGRFFPHWDDE
ncbi:MAG: hypothetical protein H6667_20605 [Ardenticatenaceae bacterium]|nr:hypothetical protein [Ardenticatenaceae bacterium]MCB9445715.1 hypothetical protein [Ardenticatenaceae bacterium]